MIHILLYEDLKVIFLTETKCRIRFIHAKEKKWGKKCLKTCAIKGEGVDAQWQVPF